MDDVRSRIRDVPDFPRPGIIFKDLTPVLSDPKLLKRMLDAMGERWRSERIDKVVGIESRGFVFAAPLAYLLGAGCTLVRKPGKLPYNTIRESYALEYGQDHLELHVDAVAQGERVLIVDDLLATGGTASAAGKLVARQGGQIAGYGFAVELGFLGGAQKLRPHTVHSLLTY